MENFESSRQLYEELLAGKTIDPRDATQFVNLLLSVVAWEREREVYSGVDYTASVDRVLKQLESTAGTSVALLQLRIRLAMVRGEDANVGKIAENWVASAGDLQSLGMQNLWEITGQSLVRLGKAEEAISWLEKVYAQDPKKFESLAVALANDKQYDRAIELCMKILPSRSVCNGWNSHRQNCSYAKEKEFAC